MSDVIEVMARALDDGDYPMATYRRDVIEVLEAAEKAGWRLVPTKASGKQVNMLIAQELSHAFYERLIDATPRPWDEVERRGCMNPPPE